MTRSRILGRPASGKARAVVVAVSLVGASASAVVLAAPAGAATFSNTTPINVADATFCSPCVEPPGLGSPYPSNIAVSGMGGVISKVTVTLSNVSHPSPGDLDFLLVGPGGQKFILVSDAGGNIAPATNATVTLDDAAASTMPATGGWSSGTFKPTNNAGSGGDQWPAPAPAGPYGDPAPTGSATLASVFNGADPNGTWSLFVTDDTDGAIGSIAGGWSLNITTLEAAVTTTTVTSSDDTSFTGDPVTFTATVTSANAVNAGTVTFSEGATTLAGNVAVNSTGVAAFTTSALTEGVHTITAAYNGTASFGPSSGTVAQTVDNHTTVTGTTYCNTGAVTIHDAPSLGAVGTATPYPSHILVGGISGNIATATVTLKNLSDPYADDIDVLLVGPGGQKLIVASDAGGHTPLSNNTVKLDDAAANALPSSGGWPNGTYQPANYSAFGESSDGFPPPAPSSPSSPAPTGSATLASVFGGIDGTGTWSLYVTDDSLGDGNGSLAGGWCLTLSPAPTAVDDTYSTGQDTTLKVPAPGVLANDSGTPAPAAQPISNGGTTQHGTVTLNADGSFTYTPPAGFTGDDTFDYVADNGATDTATVTVHVTHRPAITGDTITRQQGSGPTNSHIADVSDVETPNGDLVVHANPPVAIDVSDIVNTNGSVTADVAASCTASSGATSVPLTATDADGNVANGTLTVNVTGNTPPTLGYDDAAMNAGDSVQLDPAAGPSDNGLVSMIDFHGSTGGFSGSASVAGAGSADPGRVSISGVSAGDYTLTVRGTDNCGEFTDATFALSVNGPPAVDAGPDQTVLLAEGATLAGVVTDDGRAPGNHTPTVTWSKESGPGSVGFASASDPTTTASFSAPGVYLLKLSASDGQLNDADIVEVTVQDAPHLELPDDITVVENPAGSGSAPVSFTVGATGFPAPSMTCHIDGASVGGSGSIVFTDRLFTVGSHWIGCTATNAAGEDSAGFSVTVTPANRPPVADAGGPYSVAEGSSLTLDGTASSDPDGDALAYTWDVNGDGTFGDAMGATPTLTWAELVALGIDHGPASFAVKVRVSDGSLTTTSSATLTMLNTAPTASISGPSDIARGTPLRLSFGATDPSPVDQAAGFTYRIDWGDGTTSTPSGGSPLSRPHTYTDVGVYTVTVRATDKDGGTGAVATKTVTVSGIELVHGACGGTDLTVGGTSGNDRINVSGGTAPGTVQVRLNNVTLGTFAVSGRVVVLARAGDDTITFGRRLAVGHTIFAGRGNDTVSDGNGSGVLVGGRGADDLSSGNGRDVLIGGLGADILGAGNGDDLLIAGSTTYGYPTSPNQAALCAIQAEWTRTDVSYLTRIAHLDGSLAGGLNGRARLLAVGAGRNVFDDSAVDNLTGGLGSDWFLLNRVDGTLDSSDARPGELRTDLS